MHVHAPRFFVEECRNEREKEFILALHARAEAGDWEAEGFPSCDGRFTAARCACGDRSVLRTLRVDFDGDTLLMGKNETHQFVTDLDPSRPDVIQASGKSPSELAGLAADWLEREIARPVDRHDWGFRSGSNARWVLADTGECVTVSGFGRKKLGPPLRITRVWPAPTSRSLLRSIAKLLGLVPTPPPHPARTDSGGGG